MRFFRWFLLIFTLLVSNLVFGQTVNSNNGNFSLTLKDISISSGTRELSILRTYNSKSVKVGWFGFGWNNYFETHLKPSADGSVTVYEYGSGKRVQYEPTVAYDVKGAADKIIAAMRKSGLQLSKEAEKNKRDTLMNDARERQLMSERYLLGKTVSDGTVLVAKNQGGIKLFKKGGKYRRFNADGKEEIFNDKGQLEKIKDGSYQINFKYKTGTNNIIKIEDSLKKYIDIKWDPSGKVQEISSGKGKAAKYVYDKDNNLIKSSDVDGNTYEFVYNGVHNMTAIKYSDGKQMKLDYNNVLNAVSSVTNKDGSKIVYDYKLDPKKKDKNYRVVIKQLDAKGKVVSTDDRQYVYDVRKGGGRFLKEYIERDSKGAVTSRRKFDSQSGKPLLIKIGDESAEFKYSDKDRQMIEKITKIGKRTVSVVKLEYNKDNKVSKIKNPQGEIEYYYDKKKNLKSAIKKYKNENVKINLHYEKRSGNINKIINKSDKERVELYIKYDRGVDKPEHIRVVRQQLVDAAGKKLKKPKKNDLGAIKVQYDSDGNIKKIERVGKGKMSAGKRAAAEERVADEISDTINEIWAVIQPSGVGFGL